MKVNKLKQLVQSLEELLDSPESVGRFDMAHFGAIYELITPLPNSIKPVCNTAACLAGQTVLVFGTGVLNDDGGIDIIQKLELPSGWDDSRNNQILAQATKDLGLTANQRDRLFFFKGWYNVGTEETVYTGWPEQFRSQHDKAKTQQGRILAAIRRVEHFIKTQGRE
jgi:hypothetical protein